MLEDFIAQKSFFPHKFIRLFFFGCLCMMRNSFPGNSIVISYAGNTLQLITEQSFLELRVCSPRFWPSFLTMKSQQVFNHFFFLWNSSLSFLVFVKKMVPLCKKYIPSRAFVKLFFPHLFLSPEAKWEKEEIAK